MEKMVPLITCEIALCQCVCELVSGIHIHVCIISSTRKKQASVSRSSTESEIISLDAGLRMDEIPALDLWDLVLVEVLHSSFNQTRTSKETVQERLAA